MKPENNLFPDPDRDPEIKFLSLTLSGNAYFDADPPHYQAIDIMINSSTPARKSELLMPAGSLEKLKVAILYGLFLFSAYTTT